MTASPNTPKAPQVGNSGAGGANQLSVEAFADAAGVSIGSVPFRGSPEARTACIGGHIDLPAAAKAASDSGQMTPLFAMEDERIDLFPDTPTAVEKGVDFIWSSWKGVIGPKRQSSHKVQRSNQLTYIRYRVAGGFCAIKSETQLSAIGFVELRTVASCAFRTLSC